MEIYIPKKISPDRRPISVTVIGWVELVKGGIGSLTFLMMAIGLIAFFFGPYYKKNNYEGVALVFCLVAFIYSLPSFFLLWSAIGILKLRNFARKLNIALNMFFLLPIPLWTIGNLIYEWDQWNQISGYAIRQKQFRILFSLLITEIFILILILPTFVILNMPTIKKQFKNNNK